MIKRRSVFILLILCTALAACTSIGPFRHPARCVPQFPDQDGWYGGDGAYSILLDEKRTLWLFGDTFVSDEAGKKDRTGMDVVMGNTLAISTCSPSHEFSIHYFLKKNNGAFESFFGAGEILWPQDPFIAGGRLYIPLLIIRTLPDAPAPFNFKIAGHKIARVSDFSDADPRKWPVEYIDWTSALPLGIEALATTSIVEESYVYFFPLYRNKQNGTHITGNILARIPVAKLDRPSGAFEYLNGDGTWTSRIIPGRISILFNASVSELSVRFHRPNRTWLAVYLSPADRGRKLLVQSAGKLEGPWSAPVPLIASVPEVDPSSSVYHPDTFCYAGKEHRQFAQDQNLVVTYVCNAYENPDATESFLRKNLFLYRPVVNNISYP